MHPQAHARSAGYRPAPPVLQTGFNHAAPDGCHIHSRHDGWLGRWYALVEPVGLSNYLTSLARMNDLQTERLAMENQRQNAEDQLQLRKRRAELREAENQKRVALIRQHNAARPHAARPASVVSPISGDIAWPAFLQGDEFGEYRALANQLLQQRDRTGQIAAADGRQIERMTEKILEQLKAEIQNMRPQDYVAVKGFTRGLLAELRSRPLPDDRSRAGGLMVQAKPAGE
jgi:hypothetical protein